MKNYQKLPPVLKFQYDWPSDLHAAYEEMYDEIIASPYLAPEEIPFQTVNQLPKEDGYYRIIKEDDEEFWFVKDGIPSHKTTFWLQDWREQKAYPYSNTDLKKHTSDAAKYIIESCEKLCKEYGIKDYNLRLMTLKPGDYLTWHKDSQKTLAAINHNIGKCKDSVKFFEDDYEYDTALLNIQEYHSVENQSNETRVTIKITSRDLSYETLYKRIDTSSNDMSKIDIL